jgi:hypothetical protein
MECCGLTQLLHASVFDDAARKIVVGERCQATALHRLRRCRLCWLIRFSRYGFDSTKLEESQKVYLLMFDGLLSFQLDQLAACGFPGMHAAEQSAGFFVSSLIQQLRSARAGLFGSTGAIGDDALILR